MFNFETKKRGERIKEKENLGLLDNMKMIG